MNNDLISREALKVDLAKEIKTNDMGLWLKILLVIDNAPTVELDESVIQEVLNKRCMTAVANEYLIELHGKRPQGEWTPVSERLPDKNMPCLVSVGKFNLTQIAVYSDLMKTIDHKIFYQGDYGKNNFQNITEYVNAWMPLPEPYKKGGAE